MSQRPQKNGQERHWSEEIEAVGGELIERVKSLVKAGNVRRLIVRNASHETLLDVPLTPAAAVGAAAVIINPILAALGVLAALAVRLKIEIVRVETIDESSETIEISDEDVSRAATEE